MKRIAMLLMLWLAGCGIQKPAVVTLAPAGADAAVSNGQAAGGVEAVQADTKDAAIAVADDAARLEAVILGAVKAGWQTVSGKASEIVGSLRRTAAVLKAKEVQFAAIQKAQGDTQAALASERKANAATLATEKQNVLDARAETAAARSGESAWARRALAGLIVLAVVGLAGGIVVLFSFPAFAMLGKGIAIASGVLIVVSGLTITFLGVTERLIPWIVGGVGGLIVLGVAAVGYVLVQHRNALADVVKSWDAASVGLPAVAADFRAVAAQIQTPATEALVKKYQTPNELPAVAMTPPVQEPKAPAVAAGTLTATTTPEAVL